MSLHVKSYALLEQFAIGILLQPIAKNSKKKQQNAGGEIFI